LEADFGLKTNPSDCLILIIGTQILSKTTHHLLSVVGKLCVIAIMSEISKLIVDSLKAYYITKEGIVKAVDSVSFEINGHESFGIAGETASGKSTLGLALLRSLQLPGKIVGGNITLQGQNISNMSDDEFNKTIRWKKIAMVFQGAMNTLDPVYTIGSQMSEIIKEHRVDVEQESLISNSLMQVGLDPSVSSRYPHELSGGMKQRVVIAMALLLDPDIVIADEPTTALDVLVQAQIIELLKTLRKERGLTVILITHDLNLILEFADKIGIMYAGQLVEFGNANDLYLNPRHPYTQALIASIPRLHSVHKDLQFIAGSSPNMLELPTGCRFFSRCPFAKELCREDPPQIKLENGFVRCWLYK
jgi:peptide/nickel transport system ATP-binding protein